MDHILEIDLREMLYACLRKMWLIILCAVVLFAAVFAYTTYCVTPLYKTGATFYVNNSTTAGSNTSISSSDLATSQRLVLTYVNIIKSDTVLEKVIAETGLSMTPDALRGIMTAESIDNTEMFSVQISYPDPELAARIANAVAAVAPTEIANIMVGSTTKVVDMAKVPKNPYTPDRTGNAMLGAAAGVVLAIAVIVIQVLMDVRVRGGEDLPDFGTVPVLGVIPKFDTDTKKKRRGHRKSRKKERG